MCNILLCGSPTTKLMRTNVLDSLADNEENRSISSHTMQNSKAYNLKIKITILASALSGEFFFVWMKSTKRTITSKTIILTPNCDSSETIK